MIRQAAQTLKHFALAVVLLVGGVCAVEVGLRIQRASQVAGLDSKGGDSSRAPSVPSRSTYLSVTPKLRYTRVDAESGRPYTVRTNSFGLRSPEVEVPRPAGVFRILVLGDDNTFAAELPESFTFVRQLTDLVQARTSTKVEVLNAGCPGGCPTVSALLLRHHLMTLQPDAIVVYVDPTDPADEEELRRHVERNSTGDPVCAVHPATAGKPNLVGELDNELLIVRAAREGLQDLWARGQSGGSKSQNRRTDDLRLHDNGIDSIRLALAAIKRLAQSQSIEVLVATATNPQGTRRNSNAVSAGQWPAEELRAACEELALPLIDATSQIASELEPESPRRMAQRLLDQDSHAILAEVLADGIISRFTQTTSHNATDSPPDRNLLSDKDQESAEAISSA